MPILNINSYCTEQQIKLIVDNILNHIYNNDINDIPDYDNLIDDIRVCVDFDSLIGILEIKNAEILDNDWNLLINDSVVLNDRLIPFIEEYNMNNKGFNLTKQEYYN